MSQGDRRTGAAAPGIALRLKAQEPEDLEILSALLQDAVGRVGAIRWSPAERRFLLPLQRFRWEEEARDERVSAALAIENVLSAKARGLRPGDPQAALSLLALEFRRDPAPASAGPEEEGPPRSPGGELLLFCSEGAAFSLRVEALEASLTDLAPPRAAAHRPRHLPARRSVVRRWLFKGKGF